MFPVQHPKSSAEIYLGICLLGGSFMMLELDCARRWMPSSRPRRAVAVLLRRGG
jgi:hypothetical protein